jgi:hypothetical protein
MLTGGKKLRSFLGAALALCFALQILVALPAHSFHGANEDQAVFGHQSSPDKAPAEDGHCGFFLAFSVMDTGSVGVPALLGLLEASFTWLAEPVSAHYSSPRLSAFARGPPSFLA